MTGLDVIARLADTTVAAIRELNPQYLRLATPPAQPRRWCGSPPGAGPTTVAAYAELPPERRVTFVEHSSRRGETMGGIARRYRVSSRLLQEANPRVQADAACASGQRLVVPTGGAISSVRGAPHGGSPSRPAGTSTSGYHRVRRGETLSGHRRRVRREPAAICAGGTALARAAASGPASGSGWPRRAAVAGLDRRLRAHAHGSPRRHALRPRQALRRERWTRCGRPTECRQRETLKAGAALRIPG